MLRRSTILLLIACFLGTPVLMHAVHEGQRCASATGQPDAFPLLVSDPAGVCRSISSDPLWARLFGLLSLVAMAAAAFDLSSAYRGRRRERDLLARVGVRVDEADLPLED